MKITGKMKLALLATSLFAFAFLAQGESCDSSDTIQQQQQEQILMQETQSIGMPNIHNYFEKKTAKMIMEKRDKPDLTTYLYTQAMDGKFVYMGRAVGYGLPYSTEYTNPEKVDNGGRVIPQADPNGLFAPPSANATWILYVDEATNEEKVMYMEPNAVVVETKLPKRLCEDWSLPSNY